MSAQKRIEFLLGEVGVVEVVGVVELVVVEAKIDWKTYNSAE